ncbi:FAD-dependent thymidylate synthase [Actinacidiphila glaucinigra]|nr:FAD-dependent thymidylate synthase [Actinacidiphila glaucinigra]
MTVQLVKHSAADEDVVFAARVSTKGAESLPTGTFGPAEKGLINFLMRDRHGSPFEHNSMTLYVEAPIFVLREWQRHRVASYNEESARYRELKPVFYLPADDRKVVQVGRPGRYTFEPGTRMQRYTARRSIEMSAYEAWAYYREMLGEGIAREVARSVLPVSIYSSMYVTLNARSLMHFLSLRTEEEAARFPSHPQREIAMCAEQVEAIFAELMPVTYAAFQANGRVAP